jgi:hypothetical protein
MGKGWLSDQWGRCGGLTNVERMVVPPLGKGRWSDQWGRSGGLTNGFVTMGKGWWSDQRLCDNGEGLVVFPTGGVVI